MVLYKCSINSVVVLDQSSTENELISFEIEEDAEDSIWEVNITAKNTLNDTISLSVGQTLEIWRGFTTSTDEKIFDGRIVEIKPKGGLIEIVGRNKLNNLVKKNINKVYNSADIQAGVISEIAKDLIETGGLTAMVQDTGTINIIKQFKCINTDIWERLQALKKAVNYQIRYEADTDIVHFEPRGFNNTGLTLTVGTEIINLPDWDYDTSKLVNSLRVDGATILTDLRFPTSGTGQIGTTTDFETTGITLPKTPEIVQLTIDSSNPPTTLREGGADATTPNAYYYVNKENKQVLPTDTTGAFTTDDYAFVNYTWASPVPIIMENETSISDLGGRPDGVYEKQLTYSDISNIADAETRAIEFLARFSTPLLNGKIRLRNTSSLNLKVGDTILIVDNISKPAINRTFVIVKRTIKFPGDIEEMEVGDSLLRITDWEMQTEERIKRLEEELLRNQDLIVQIIQTNLSNKTENNTKLNYIRYNKIQTQAYTTADNTLIWDHPTHGVWDTDNWATEINPDGFDDEVDNFIQNFDLGTANKYSEDFIDDDFSSSNTTASWGTTGNVTFTSGQIAESSSIDLNNGVVNSAILTSTEITENDFSTNLQNWWKLDNDYTDTIGGITGSPQNSPTFTNSARVGNYATIFTNTPSIQSVYFGAKGENVLNWDYTSDYTISMWVYPTNNVEAVRYGLMEIIDVDGRDWVIGLSTPNRKLFTGTWDGSLGDSITGTTELTINAWNHVAVTWSNGSIEIFVNGVLDGTGTFGTIAIGGENQNKIGLEKIFDGAGYIGRIDDVRFYTSILSDENISQLSKAGGSLVYQMTADGTNWETVTSGSSHTFTSTGTDLRWRATENGGSTAGISKIVVSSYH